jgi:hypothetical protein
LTLCYSLCYWRMKVRQRVAQPRLDNIRFTGADSIGRYSTNASGESAGSDKGTALTTLSSLSPTQLPE